MFFWAITLLVIITVNLANAAPFDIADDETPGCNDEWTSSKCVTQKAAGYCTGSANAERNCRKTCGFCGNSDCPWLISSGLDDFLQCEDGQHCNWKKIMGIPGNRKCCDSHGGRQKCPQNKPFMCANRRCETLSKGCKNHGGLRPCENDYEYGNEPPPPPEDYDLPPLIPEDYDLPPTPDLPPGTGYIPDVCQLHITRESKYAYLLKPESDTNGIYPQMEQVTGSKPESATFEDFQREFKCKNLMSSDCNEKGLEFPLTCSFPPCNQCTVANQDLVQCNSLEISSAGTSDVNGVYKIMSNAENVEIGFSGFQASQLINTWQYGTFQIYCFTLSNGNLYWRISKMCESKLCESGYPLKYFYKGPGDENDVPDWIYQAGEIGKKPDPIVSCKKGCNDEWTTSKCVTIGAGYCTGSANAERNCRKTCGFCY